MLVEELRKLQKISRDIDRADDLETIREALQAVLRHLCSTIEYQLESGDMLPD